MDRVAASCSNRFSVSVIKELNKGSPHNIIASGYSIFYVSVMAMIGCSGETYQELKKGLFINDSIKEEDLLLSLKQSNSLLSESSSTFISGNSIWTNGLRDEYQEIVKNALDGHSFPLTTAEAINNYVSSNTNDLIKSVIKPPLNRDTLAVLVNSIYFKGTWKDKFPERSTRPADFTLSNGNTITVDTMRTKGNFLALTSKSIVALELPYVGEEFVMDIILPERPLSSLVSDLDSDKLIKMINSMKIQKNTEIYLPKFKLDYQNDKFKDIMIQLGINKLFSSQAELDKMASEPAFVSDFIHKAVCIVNEEGTEAAAASAAVISRCIVQTQKIHINRPFLFVIRHKPSSIILFTGLVEDPSKC